MIPTQLLLSAQLITLRDNLQLLHVGPLTKLAACAAATAALWLTLKYGRHPLALPAMLCGIPAFFHVARLAAGWSIAELQDSGWLLQSKVTPVCSLWYVCCSLTWCCLLLSVVTEKLGPSDGLQNDATSIASLT